MSRVSIYQVIYNDLVSQIHDGIIRPGATLPAETELCQRYGVSRMTVRQAIDQLAREHLVIRRRGARTLVADHGESGRQLNSLRSLHAELGVSADAVASKILECRMVSADAEIARRLNLAVDASVALLARLRLVDGRPVVLQNSWLPGALVPQLTREPLVGDSLYRTLQERWGLQLVWAEQRVSATVASRRQARLLQVKERSPLIAAERLTYTDGNIAVEFSRSWTTTSHPVVIRLDRL